MISLFFSGREDKAAARFPFVRITNPKLVPYETIIRATSGEPEAVDEVLRHYSKRIRIASLENGQVNKDTEDNIKRRLIA